MGLELQAFSPFCTDIGVFPPSDFTHIDVPIFFLPSPQSLNLSTPLVTTPNPQAHVSPSENHRDLVILLDTRNPQTSDYVL